MFNGFGASDIGKQRSHNEDTYLINNASGLFAVADGVGGDGRGKLASQKVLAEFELQMVTLMQNGQSINTESGLHMLTGINQALTEYGQALTPPLKLASTFTALIIPVSGAAWLLHVGDSRLYGLTVSGQLLPLTGEHTLAAELKKQGQHKIDPLMENALVNCMGQLRPDWHEVRPVTLNKFKAFLICSDGLNKMISHETLEQIMVSHWNSPGNCIPELIEAALAAGGTDNVTVLTVVRNRDLSN